MYKESFWKAYWENNHIPWDMGHVSPPLKDYFDQLTDKSMRILIPGAGNAWEAEYLWRQGFHNLDIVDISDLPLQNFKNRVPDFPDQNIIHNDFFNIQDKYDLVVEQTFFCALHPSMRKQYVEHMKNILKPGAKLVGLLFTFPLDPAKKEPPFGGSVEEYQSLFSSFLIKVMEPSFNSHQARIKNEIFIILHNNTS